MVESDADSSNECLVRDGSKFLSPLALAFALSFLSGDFFCWFRFVVVELVPLSCHLNDSDKRANGNGRSEEPANQLDRLLAVSAR